MSYLSSWRPSRPPSGCSAVRFCPTRTQGTVLTPHAIRIDIADRGLWNVSGAVRVENSKTPTAHAVKALAASGGAPFTARVNRVLDYKPSQARMAVDRSGKIHHHMGADFSPERSPAFFSAAT